MSSAVTLAPVSEWMSPLNSSCNDLLSATSRDSLVLFYVGASVLPISKKTFCTSLLVSLGIFSLWCFSVGGIAVFSDRIAISNAAPLVAFSFIIFFVIDRIRSAKIASQMELERLLSHQESLIAEQSKEIAAAEVDVRLGKITAQVAHDIRSPLAALKILLSDGMPVSPSSKTIAAAIKRMEDIVTDLLSIKRSQIVSTHPSAAANELTGKCVEQMIFELISEKEIEFSKAKKVHCSTRIHPSVATLASIRGNSPILKRVLSNVLNNSFEAINRSGEIVVSSNIISNSIEIKVSDTGMGISEELLTRIGTEGATEGKINGTGLGLAMVIQHISDWGGCVDISSSQGNGTTVTMTLPFGQQPGEFVGKRA